MKYTTKQIGDTGEAFVTEYLKAQGYNILEKNYKKRCGEIDIIAARDEYTVFVEVKTRHENSLVEPWEAVDKRKQRKLIKTATVYLTENNIETYVRFDIAEVIIKRDTLELISINYIEDAFIQEDGYANY